MFKASLAVLAAYLVGQAAANGGVTSYVIGGTTYPGWQPYISGSGQSSIERPYSSFDPILSVTASTLACNDNGQSSAGQLSATVAAGTSITAKWSQWTDAQGPVMVYMASCKGPCSSANANNLKWFKISEAGLLSGNYPNGHWALADVMATLSYTTTIPSALADGEYLIRHELLALHQANTPKFYPECAQLIVTGGGGKTPGSSYLVSFPGAYSANDSNIYININSPESFTKTTYKIPGPPVWNGQ